jgi:hypothetical protein
LKVLKLLKAVKMLRGHELTAIPESSPPIGEIDLGKAG